MLFLLSSGDTAAAGWCVSLKMCCVQESFSRFKDEDVSKLEGEQRDAGCISQYIACVCLQAVLLRRGSSDLQDQLQNHNFRDPNPADLRYRQEVLLLMKVTIDGSFTV